MKVSMMLLAVLGGVQVANAITINVLFDPSFSDPMEQDVVLQAASEWETAIVSNGGQLVKVTVTKSTLGNLLGEASNYTNTGRIPTGGTMIIDNQANFFVDLSPDNNLEYSWFFGDPYYWRATSSSPKDAQIGYDLLSVARHEFGHLLGFTSNAADFAAGLIHSPELAKNGRWIYEFSAPSTVPDYSGGYFSGILPHGGVYMRDDPNCGGDGDGPCNWDWEEENSPPASPGPLPSHTDQYGGPEIAAGSFPFDVMGSALNVGERKEISDTDLNILADAFGYEVKPTLSSATWIAMAMWTSTT